MLSVALIFSVIVASCTGDKPHYLRDGIKVEKNTSNALPQVSVTFVPEYLPAATTGDNSISIYVTSTSGATRFRYALLSGHPATKGATACAEADYSEFLPLKDPITASDLPDGLQLLCARGKNDAGIAQGAATTHSWQVDSSLAADEDAAGTVPTGEEQADTPPTIVINVPSPPVPAPAPATPMPAPDSEAEMQIRKNNNSAVLAHAFVHGQTDAILYRVHNTGDTTLKWSLKLDATDSDWLQVEYGGDTKIGSSVAFSGDLAGNSISSPLALSLVLDDRNRIDTKYLAVTREGSARKEVSEYQATLVFENKDAASETVSVSVSLLIPRLSLKKTSPARKHRWQLPIKNGDHSWKKLLIEKRGKGLLYWNSSKTDYNLFEVRTNNIPNAGYLEIRLRRRGQEDNSPPRDGEHSHMRVESNGGATYIGQPDPSVRWLYVCVLRGNMNGNVNSSTECPEHVDDHN